jgi:hypothetical protein
LVYALEDGPYGRSYIEVLDRQLLSLIEHYRDTQ